MTHCLASPSSSDRWIRCTGSLHLLSQHPQPYTASPQAEYGTQVHDLARLLIGQSPPAKQRLAALYLGTRGYSHEQMQEALSYSDYIDGIVTKCDSPQLSIENKVCIPSVDPEVFGTPDAIVYDEPAGTLHIADLKTGRVPVAAEYNSQLLLYAQGAVDTYRYDPRLIVLHIYQNNDRCGSNVNEWTLTRRYLREFTKLVQARFALFRQSLHSFTVGPHCRYCPVRQHCTAFSQEHTAALKTLESAAQDSTAGAVTIGNAAPRDLAALYRQYKALLPFIESIEARLLETPPSELEGTQVTIRSRRAPLAYEDSAAALEDLMILGADLDTVAPRVLISPARLRQLSEDLFAAVARHVGPQGSTQYLSIEKQKSKQVFN